MSIFGSIKNAIFGHPKAKQSPQQPAPQPTPAPPVPQAQPAPTPTPAAAPAAPQPVDVEFVLMAFETERGKADLNWRMSIVDLMKLLGLDSSLDKRRPPGREALA